MSKVGKFKVIFNSDEEELNFICYLDKENYAKLDEILNEIIAVNFYNYFIEEIK